MVLPANPARERRQHGLQPVALRLSMAALVLLTASTAGQAASLASCTRPAMIVDDASSSMGVRTTRITRHEAGRRALARIVPPVSTVRPLGLRVYSGGATRCDDIRLKVAPVLGSGRDILSALAEVNPAGATPMGHAIEEAAAYFHDRAEAATLVVVTDGLENCGADLCRLASQLSRTVPSIEIQLIGYGLLTSEGDSMRCLADQNGGKYTPVGTPDQLTEALEQSLACPAVSELEPSRIE